MAITAEQTTDILRLVVTASQAAAGAAQYAALADKLEGGSNMEDLAEIIVAQPEWSGDTGLYPDYLPNAIFAEQYITNLVGAEVSAEALAGGIVLATSMLNGGMTRAQLIMEAYTYLSDPLTLQIPEFAPAAVALANQTEVSEYYTLDVDQDGDVEALQAAIAGVDSSATAVADGIAAVDDVIAGNADLNDLIANLDAANEAKAAHLASIDGDPLTTTTDAQLALDQTAVETLVEADPAIAAGYIGGSSALKAALVGDAAVLDAASLKVLTDAAAVTAKATAAVVGLDAARAVHASALDAQEDNVDADTLSSAALAEQIVKHGISDGAVTVGGTTPLDATYTVGTDLIIGGSTTSPFLMEIKPGFTEATNPGITALWIAAITDQGAFFAAFVTGPALVLSTLDGVENLDPGAAAVAPLAAVGAGMELIVPASVAAPTIAEITAETAALASLLTAGNAAAVVGGEADLDAAIATLTADITTAGDGDAAAIAVLTATAVSDGYITSADKALIDAAAATAAAANAVLADENASARDAAFAVLTVAYYATGGTAVAAATSPLSFADDGADTLVGLEMLSQAGLAVNVADDNELTGQIAESTALSADIAAANKAFSDAGYAVPVSLTLAVHAATAADDLFTAADTTSQVISFAGDDLVFIGEDLTRNDDTTAGDEGDDTVLEYWITGTSSAVVTIETSVFGSSAVVPETFSITLTGVPASAVAVDAEGFLNIA